jgi:hypothetical protein
MPVLAVNQPVEQRSPRLLVENRLAAGVHRFSLVVLNAAGVASEPHAIAVTVRTATVRVPGPVAPAPVLRPEPLRPVVTPVVRPVVAPVVTPVLTPAPNPGVRPRGPGRPGDTDGPA